MVDDDDDDDISSAVSTFSIFLPRLPRPQISTYSHLGIGQLTRMDLQRTEKGLQPLLQIIPKHLGIISIERTWLETSSMWRIGMYCI